MNTNTSRKLIGLAFIFSGLILIYSMRFGWILYLLSLRGPFGLMALCIIGIPFILLVIIGIAIAIPLLVKSYRQTQNKLVPIFLLLAMIMGYFLPLPPIKMPPTPEEGHFLLNRSDYEAVVELARNNQLESDLPDCRAGFALPIEYKHTSDAQCLFVFQNDENNLVIEFSPFDWYHPIHYVEDKDASARFPCRYDGFVEVQIDDNWYVCQRDWN